MFNELPEFFEYRKRRPHLFEPFGDLLDFFGV
jgi:hypothetical protein